MVTTVEFMDKWDQKNCQFYIALVYFSLILGLEISISSNIYLKDKKGRWERGKVWLFVFLSPGFAIPIFQICMGILSMWHLDIHSCYCSDNTGNWTVVKDEHSLWTNGLSVLDLRCVDRFKTCRIMVSIPSLSRSYQMEILQKNPFKWLLEASAGQLRLILGCSALVCKPRKLAAWKHGHQSKCLPWQFHLE